MAPIKFEDTIKEKLEKRSLQPSPESWATLANRLDAEQKNKNKLLFWWFGIAASIVGIIFVTVMYFNTKSFENKVPTIVDTEEDVIQKNEIQRTEAKNVEVASEELIPTKLISNETGKELSEKTNASAKSQIQNKVSEDVAFAQAQHSTSEKSVDNAADINKTELTFEQQKVQEVVAQINDLKANGKTISDTEIDSLLKKAQKEILSNRLYNETTRTVDANTLLQDVEEDLQQSFRSKVFQALQSGYESVKTAVVQRNN